MGVRSAGRRSPLRSRAAPSRLMPVGERAVPVCGAELAPQVPLALHAPGRLVVCRVVRQRRATEPGSRNPVGQTEGLHATVRAFVVWRAWHLGPGGGEVSASRSQRPRPHPSTSCDNCLDQGISTPPAERDNASSAVFPNDGARAAPPNPRVALRPARHPRRSRTQQGRTGVEPRNSIDVEFHSSEIAVVVLHGEHDLDTIDQLALALELAGRGRFILVDVLAAASSTRAPSTRS